MRLIDADKLPATCTVSVANGNIETTGWISAERINEAPTVEAIPVEWIYENAGKYFSGLEVLHLYKMIEDWENSNG